MVGFVYSIKTRRQFDSHSLSKGGGGGGGAFVAAGGGGGGGGGGGYFLVAFDVRRMRPNLNARSLGTSI